MLVMCIDPGKASGLAILELDNDNVSIIDSLELSQQKACQWIVDNISKVDKVVCEDFIISARTAKMKTSDTRYSLEIIGLIRYYCIINKRPLILQTPVKMKTFFSGWSLRDFNLWSKSGEGHKRDAIRHGVLYLLDSNKWSPQNISPSRGDYQTLKENFEASIY